MKHQNRWTENTQCILLSEISASLETRGISANDNLEDVVEDACPHRKSAASCNFEVNN